MLDPFSNTPAPAELHGADAGRKHLGIDDFTVALLDQEAWHAAPAEIERERQADRPAPDDENRHLQHDLTFARPQARGAAGGRKE